MSDIIVNQTAPFNTEVDEFKKTGSSPARFSNHHFETATNPRHGLLWKLVNNRPVLSLFRAVTEVVSWIVRPPKLTPRENTARCYGKLFDPLCADTGVWPDYTEGYYETGHETYEAAQRKQIDAILFRAGCKKGVRLMDIGCGNGRLLRRARELGATVSGVTVAETQVDHCRSQGLDVHLCSFDAIPEHFPPGEFDIVVMNGPTEHFINEEDMLAGRDEGVRQALFRSVKHLLKPGGRLFITALHFREEPDIKAAVKHPLSHPLGSDNFYYSLLVAIYSGWYAREGDFTRNASAIGLQKKMVQDHTADYLFTSLDWDKRFNTFYRKNKLALFRFMTKLFRNDPRYVLIAYLFYAYGAWGWQFYNGHSSPIQQLWLMYELPSGVHS